MWLWYNKFMGWFNYYGLIIMAVIMMPNIAYAFKNKSKSTAYNNKAVTIAEQIGRYGCFILIIFNIPYTYFNSWFNNVLTVYLLVNAILCVAYLIFWIICWKRNGLLKTLSLSIIPSIIFLFDVAILANIPLCIFAIIFASSHIYISYNNRGN